MPTLRLTQSTVRQNHYRVEIRYENEPPIPVEFDFQMSDQDYSDIRWYLEEFLQFPMEPAPEIAHRIGNTESHFSHPLAAGWLTTHQQRTKQLDSRALLGEHPCLQYL